jgi:predicted ATP-grasp superfamily ATP-dependent carboligase
LALVLGADPNGLGVIRSLGAKGIRIWAADPDRLAPGLFSRFVERRLICPDPTQEPEALIAFLRQSAERVSSPPVLFPTTDPYVHVLADHAAALEGHYLSHLARREIIAAIVDKRRQYSVARKHRIPMPTTCVLDGPEKVADLASGLRFPCVLKPAFSDAFRTRFNFKAIEVGSPEELLEVYRRHLDLGHPLLAQEIIPGGAENLVEVMAFVRRDGVLGAAFAARKLEQFPEDYGSGTIFESVPIESLLPLVCRVLEAFEFTGLCNVEFKWDATSRQFKFIELNPRTSNCSLHPTECGINFPWLAYLDTTGAPPAEPQFAYEPGKIWVLPEVRIARLGRLVMPSAAPRRNPWARRYIQGVASMRDPVPELFFLLRGGLRDAERAWSRVRRAT